MDHYTAIQFLVHRPDAWTVTFGTASRSLGRMRPYPAPSSLYQM